MRTDLILELLDVPGQLVNVLSPISQFGANLVTVIHRRDDKNDDGMIPVQITLEGEQKSLIRCIDKLKEMNITILEINGVLSKERLKTILIGHVIDTDIRNTMDRINELEGTSILSLEIKLSDEDESSAMLVIESIFGMKNTVFTKIQEIANEKSLLMVNEV
ncbi:MAG: amino acid-binding protein [Methanobrevibacter sp.]|jgi:ACT domain-containing protein|nr:amino acid-binding protein [Candidatus Methanovirga basalitermitum]